MSDQTTESKPPTLPPSVPPQRNSARNPAQNPPRGNNGNNGVGGPQVSYDTRPNPVRQPQPPTAQQPTAPSYPGSPQPGGTSSRPTAAPNGGYEEMDVAHPRGAASQQGSKGSKERAKPPGPRRVRLAVSRVDPWSVMKLSFLLSIALGIGLVVATATVWTVLNEMEVFAQIRNLIVEVEAMQLFGPILEFLEFSRVISVATVIAVVDIVLITALATLGAFIYNLVASMVGGLHLTLTDD